MTDMEMTEMTEITKRDLISKRIRSKAIEPMEINEIEDEYEEESLLANGVFLSTNKAPSQMPSSSKRMSYLIIIFSIIFFSSGVIYNIYSSKEEKSKGAINSSKEDIADDDMLTYSSVESNVQSQDKKKKRKDTDDNKQSNDYRSTLEQAEDSKTKNDRLLSDKSSAISHPKEKINDNAKDTTKVDTPTTPPPEPPTEPIIHKSPLSVTTTCIAPLTNNLALNKPTTQSSTTYDGKASRATDGNRDGDYHQNSVTATDTEVNPWWQVDLGELYEVVTVLLFNRVDQVPERLTNFHVELLDEQGSVVVGIHETGMAGPVSYIRFPPGKIGRKVRVRLEGTDVLSLAEVEVYGPTSDESVYECMMEDKKKEKKLKAEKDNAVHNTDYGEWEFADAESGTRPTEDYCGKYPHRDIPGGDFPEKAWQKDPTYLNNYLDEGLKLISRAREAIWAEYGHGRPRTDEETAEAEKVFRVNMLTVNDARPSEDSEIMSQGGWSTEESMEDLKRRLLHAVMTNADFTVVMGGHSAAAGHGNHFKQSYMMQFHHVMEPILSHFGVKLATRNIAMGGLGTIQMALGARSLYGEEIDVMLWDSGMTEQDYPSIDLFYRQSLLGSNRSPFLLCKGCVKGRDTLLKRFHTETGVGIGELGTGKYGLPASTDLVQVEHLPWAAQYLNCPADMFAECRSHWYHSMCWIDRPDVTPTTKQRDMVGGQASWHPGFREHRLTGRVMTMWMLRALEEGLTMWKERTVAGEVPLSDEHWHVTAHYEGIKSKLSSMKDTQCEKLGLSDRVCSIAMYGRTEYTPRNDPENTSLRSLLKPDGYVPEPLVDILYDREDLPIPTLQEREIDVAKIVSKTKGDVDDLIRGSNASYDSLNDEVALDDESLQQRHRQLTTISNVPKRYTFSKQLRQRRLDNTIVQGTGWSLSEDLNLGFCDGSWNSVCGRGADRDCLLSGHNDGRGHFEGDGLSGWLVMKLTNLKEGLIMANVDFWHDEVQKTKGWTEVNNGQRARGLSSWSDLWSGGNRHLEHMNVGGDQSMVIDFAINGQITTLDQDEFDKRYDKTQRVVEIVTFMDDPEFTKGEVQDVEFALRVRGCTRGKGCTLAVNHVYWA